MSCRSFRIRLIVISRPERSRAGPSGLVCLSFATLRFVQLKNRISPVVLPIRQMRKGTLARTIR
jgi:hypothetical protein